MRVLLECLVCGKTTSKTTNCPKLEIGTACEKQFQHARQISAQHGNSVTLEYDTFDGQPRKWEKSANIFTNILYIYVYTLQAVPTTSVSYEDVLATTVINKV